MYIHLFHTLYHHYCSSLLEISHVSLNSRYQHNTKQKEKELHCILRSHCYSWIGFVLILRCCQTTITSLSWHDTTTSSVHQNMWRDNGKNMFFLGQVVCRYTFKVHWKCIKVSIYRTTVDFSTVEIEESCRKTSKSVQIFAGQNFCCLCRDVVIKRRLKRVQQYIKKGYMCSIK